MPVVASLGDEAVGAEPDPVEAGDRRFGPVGLDQERPVLDRGDIAVLGGLPEPDLGRLSLRDDAAHVGARILELAERMRAKHAVCGIEGGGSFAVTGSPGSLVRIGPALSGAHSNVITSSRIRSPSQATRHSPAPTPLSPAPPVPASR